MNTSAVRMQQGRGFAETSNCIASYIHSQGLAGTLESRRVRHDHTLGSFVSPVRATRQAVEIAPRRPWTHPNRPPSRA